MDQLTSQPAIESALLRPLTATEAPYVTNPGGLIDQASALLRQRVPSVDLRIARYSTDPTDSTSLNPVVVATVLAGVIKRYLANPSGVTSRAETAGAVSVSETYVLRSERERRGMLEVTDGDVSVLSPNRSRPRAGTIRTRAALAPAPVGRYGPITSVGEALDAAVTFGDPAIAVWP